MVSPDSQAAACLPSGRNSTYRPVQISGAGSINQAGPICAESYETAVDVVRAGKADALAPISENASAIFCSAFRLDSRVLNDSY
jgi:hypothetical protein